MAFDAAAAWDDPAFRSRFGPAAQRGGSAMGYLDQGSGTSFIRPLGGSSKRFAGTGGAEQQARTDDALAKGATAFREDLEFVNDSAQRMAAVGDQAISAIQKARHARELAEAGGSGGGGVGSVLDGISSIASLGNKAGWWGGGSRGSSIAGGGSNLSKR